MVKCDGDDCFYKGNSSYQIGDLTRCVVNAHESHALVIKGRPDYVDLCDMCMDKYDTEKCALCKYEMISDSAVICEYAICDFCVRNLPLETSPNPEKLKSFLNGLPADLETKEDCECDMHSICEEEIEGLEKWISDVIQTNDQKRTEKEQRAKKLRDLAEAHLVRRGFTQGESFKLVSKFGRKVRYQEDKNIAKLLLSKLKY